MAGDDRKDAGQDADHNLGWGTGRECRLGKRVPPTPHRRARTDETEMTDPKPDLVKAVAAAIKSAWDKRPLYAGDIIEIDCAPLARAAILAYEAAALGEK